LGPFGLGPAQMGPFRLWQWPFRFAPSQGRTFTH